jgi:hypothetical protein
MEQAATEVIFARSYNDTECTSNQDCDCPPGSPSWCNDGICDTGSASGYCYRPIGSYSKATGEEALWFAFQTMPALNIDSDQFGYLISLYLYAATNDWYVYLRAKEEFGRHQISF